jgi:hypothetical protein
LALPASPSRLTNAVVEAGLVLATVALGIFGLPWGALGVTLLAAVCWWGFRHRSTLARMAGETPLKLAGLGAVSLVMILVVHAAAFWVASSVHGVF